MCTYAYAECCAWLGTSEAVPAPPSVDSVMNAKGVAMNMSNRHQATSSDSELALLLLTIERREHAVSTDRPQVVLHGCSVYHAMTSPRAQLPD